MPSAKIHIGIGALISVIIALLLQTKGLLANINSPFNIISDQIYTGIILAIIILLYSQVPDLDHQSSKVTLLFTAIGLMLAVWYLISEKSSIALVIILMLAVLWVARLFKLIKHRGRFHSFYAAPLFALPLLYFNWQIALIGLISCWSHQAADKITTKLKRKIK